jgi:hypothetical protein
MTESLTISTRPTLSIVIPTKDRYATLMPTVEAILAHIPDPELEVIVHDNSADNAPMREFIDRLADRRLIYAHLPEPVSIVQNTEPALALASGDYITFIGDDDLVAPDIVVVARALRDAGVEAATYPPAYYWWPTVKFSRPGRFHQPGAFWYPPQSNRNAGFLDSGATLQRVLAEGGAALFDLPRLYHGVVHRSVLERLKAISNHLINGASPDMALAVGLALVLKRHLLLDYPLTIFGASRDSGGGWTAANKHYGSIADQKHLPRKTIEDWNPRLPPIWSEFTIYPQTIGEVLSTMGRPDTIDYTVFYASMMVNEPHLRSLLRPLALDHLRGRPARLGRFAKTIARKAAGRMKRKIQATIVGLPYDLQILDSPDACMRALERMRCDASKVAEAVEAVVA